MTVANPYLKLSVSGYKTVKDIEYTKEFSTLVSVFNKIFHDLIDTDGDVAVPITKLGTLLAIQVNGDAVLKITDGSGTQEINVNGYLLYELNATYAATITAITITTPSTTVTDVEVTIYGA